ncbi:type IIS restriction enzyme Eco57I [Clostridium magnum DSM 2767]|uniref:site-specific DNA-methyltransferase (adenine-specific) n=1 Tax=Clostridium magnum DSM 2767 TaxID=1121326 RepID=A0A161Y6G4_9CLOT|nr:type IIS restriction enzyme Eco57I [Clostridium magnum DSM 2767]SHH98394.1 TaqI-like C-terminal specificity domain-containing protein [Clostridium magnum DSM 2767]
MGGADLQRNKEVFGAVYEKLTDRQTRKAMGMFYTPDFIVDYILQYTVSELDVLGNPFAKILDPACGAGYFLVKAYDILKYKFKENLTSLNNKYANEVYTIEDNKDENNIVKEIKGSNYWTEENLHYHILRHCLYGADLDPMAVEITKKNLISKEDKTIALKTNIILCDSLLKWEEAIFSKELKTLSCILRKQHKNSRYEDINEDKANQIAECLSEFWSNKFDYIIGNPPYIMLLQSELDEDYWKYILHKYSTIGYKKNTFYLLIERALDKLKPGGRHGFIIPDRYFLTNSYIESRKNLVNNAKIINVTQFSNPIFKEAIVGTAAYIVEKNNYSSDHKISLRLEYSGEEEFQSRELRQKDIAIDKRFILNILTKTNYKNIVEKIKNSSAELKELCEIHVGMMIKDKENNFRYASKRKERTRIAIGRDLGEYIIENENRYCCVDRLQIFGGTKNLEKHYIKPKILLRKTGNSIISSLDQYGVLAEQSAYMIIPFDCSKIYTLLGQIQSNLCNFYFKESLITNPRAYPYIQHYDVERIPINFKLLDDEYDNLIRKIFRIKNKIKDIQFSKLIKNSSYDKILYTYKENKEKVKKLENKLKKYTDESNDTIYSSYELKDSEIDLIESRIDKSRSKELYIDRDSFMPEEDCNDYYSSLVDEIYIILETEIIKLLEYNERYLSIEEVENGLKNKLKNFDDLLRVIKDFKVQKESSHIIKEILKGSSSNWNKYLKNKEVSKKGKKLVKYSKNEYGLSCWPEEIHYIWFLEKRGK